MTDPLSPYDAVLLLSYGGPQGPDDVLPFMRNATAGRGVPDSRLAEVSVHYQRFDGVSPINTRNAELLTALRAELAARGSRLPVALGNRNWHPFVSEALRELADAGARRVLALTTAAYASYSGCRQYREDLAAALDMLATGSDGATGQGVEADAAARVGGAGGGPVELVVDKTRPFYNTPGMLQANADAIAAAYDELAAQGVPAQSVHLVLVTHSIPTSMERGSAPDASSSSGGGALGPREEEAGHWGAPPKAWRGWRERPEERGPRMIAEAATTRGPLPAPSTPPAPQHPALPAPAAREPGVTEDLSTEISYVEQHLRLARVLLPAVAERVGMASPPPVDLAFCSRSGPPQARWLEPDINDRITALAALPRRPGGIIVAPIGFIADHMEVVFDLDTEARETADLLAMPYARAATAGTHPALVASLVDLLAERAAVARGESVVPTTTTGAGPFHTVCPPECCRPAVGGAHPHSAHLPTPDPEEES